MFYRVNVASIRETHMSLSSYGFIVHDEKNNEVFRKSGGMIDVPRQVVEYYSIMFALDACLNLGIDKVVIYSDNRRLVTRLSGFGPMFKGLERFLFIKTNRLIKQFETIAFESLHHLRNTKARQIAIDFILNNVQR